MSTTTRDLDKGELLGQAAELARQGRGSGGPPHDDVADLLAAYYRYVAAEDLAERTAADVYGAFASHYKLAQRRPQGKVDVRVVTPSVGGAGWSAGGHSVVEVVALDMPFLVDSLTMELGRRLRDVHLVVHPNFDVVRDITGSLEQIAPATGRAAPEGWVRESWMHVEIDRLREDPAPSGATGEPGGPGEYDGGTEADAIVDDVRRVLRDVVDAVEDWSKMHERIAAISAELGADDAPTRAALDPVEVREGAALLDWLAEGHFTFLGYREYALEEVLANGPEGSDRPDPLSGPAEVPTDQPAGTVTVLRGIPGTGLGILRADPPPPKPLPEAVRARAAEPQLLVLAKANSRSTVHRPAYLDYVGVKTFDADGRVTGERRFLGLLSSAAYTESLQRIPLVREKVAAVLRDSGFDPMSHAGKSLLDTLETYPRDDLFHTPVEELAPLVQAAMQARERRAVRVFARRDTYDRYVSVLAYLPRDRYNTAVRERFARVLTDRLGADAVEFTVRIDASTTARVHFVVRLSSGAPVPDVDVSDLERRFGEASRSWSEDFTDAVVAEHGEDVGGVLARRYVGSFPEAYKEDFPARVAAVDVGRLEDLAARLGDDGGTDQQLYQDLDAGPGEARLKLYRIGPPLSLSTLLPTLSSFGLEVVDERPYGLDGLARPSHVYDFGLRYPGELPEQAQVLFQDSLRAVWLGLTEVDGFNALVLGARLTWRQALLLRAYAKYMRQGGSPFALDYIEGALAANPETTRLLVRLFETRFDPEQRGDREIAEAVLVESIEAGLDQVASLDHDRILRSYLTHIRASLRTNYFQHAAVGPDASDTSGTSEPKPYLSIKVEPSAIPDLPQPRPRFEIFVYSPRVEGVHLRFGAVARGGLRWSDRRDDFRTEVLGLVKAQMVKNTVIVPVGAKGGFFAKQLPDPAVDRDAWLAEGIACYTTFISGLLDITDNLIDGATVPPARVVRRDGDDSYLVVAADKGTATFSDIANGVAKDYGFWLGDAFASGGSVGYDHKAMGITARGAWVSVQRHFRERGIDCQAEDFSCVGIGDMSGDVFGNGMLRSEHTRLVAAFDHRDIFLDPDPDAATSYAERARLFALPRSSWADYDRSLISEGGGVFPRAAKTVPIHAAVRRALGLDDSVMHLTPAELMRAILLAPVDLLWNGGIGTYVKGSDETNAEAGDKANDAIRVDGADLRAQCVGEGGNLGLTQAGRVEFARSRHRGRLTTDFIDNSAGVDTSDHEVNIKILLDAIVAAGDLTDKQRGKVLASMTDEVGALVLRDNYEQNLALANAETNAAPLLHVHESWMKRLEGQGVLDRALEGLPSSRQVARRLDRHEGLSAPELSVLLAWTKIVLAGELIDSDLPDDPYLDLDLRAYFPTAINERFPAAIPEHPLRRQIIVTQVVNDLVNGAGMTYWPRLAGETGASAAELTRANFVAREIFGSLPYRSEVASYDNRIDAAVQTHLRLEMRTLVERGSRWLVSNRRPPLDSQGLVDRFAAPVQALMARLPDLLVGAEAEEYAARRDHLVDRRVEEALAARAAVLPPAYGLLNVVEIALRDGLDPADVAPVHFALGEQLGLPRLVDRILRLPREDRWQTMARATLRDDLHAVHAQLTAQAMAATDAGAEPPARVESWVHQSAGQAEIVERATTTIREMCRDEVVDLARMSVGLRVVRGLLT